MRISLGMAFGIYVSLAITSIYKFGGTIFESVLDNVDEETNFESYIIRVSFLLVIACHVPYVFFSGKESLCILVDEIIRGKMTKAFEARALIIDTEACNRDIDSEKVELLAYKKMNPMLYIGLTIGLYTAEMILSIIVPSIGVIFNFIVALSLSSLAFIFPGLFYYLCQRKFLTFYDKTMESMAIAYIFFGVICGLFILVETCMQL